MRRVIFTKLLLLCLLLLPAALYAQAPAAVTLIAPENKAAGVSIQPMLYWNISAGATTYWLQISTDKDFSKIFCEVGLSAASQLPNNFAAWMPLTAAQRFENNKQYYWHVKAGNESWGPYSETRSFYTMAEVKPLLTYPVNNTVIYTKSVNFSWYTIPNSPGVKYDLIFSRTAPVDNQLVAPEGFPDLEQTYYTIYNLERGKTYYWLVRSKSAAGYIISYSKIESFSIPADPGPITPTPSWPVGGATVYTSSPEFLWYLGSADPGLEFNVYYSATPNFVIDGTTLNTGWSRDSYAKVTSDLAAGDYYWKVKSRLISDNSKESAASDEAHFKIYSGLAQTAPVPVPSWPVGAATVYSTSVQSCWYLNTYFPGLYYQIQYKKLTDASYTKTAWTQNSYFALEGLTAGESYQWQVRSSVDSSEAKASAWSTVEAKFKIDGGIIPTAIIPTPSWPIGGTAVYSKTPNFSWYVGGDGTGLQYQVQYAEDKDFTSGVVTLSPTSDLSTSGAENSLLAGKVYYWHVQSRLGLNGSWTAPSAPAEFKVVAEAAVKPLKPIISSPCPGEQLSSNTAKLQWFLPGSPEGLKFCVVIYKQTFSPENQFIRQEAITEMNATYTGFVPGATYAWVVYSYEAEHPENISEHSDVATFTVTPGILSIIPITGSPVRGVRISTDSPVLSWFVPAATSPLKYEVQYSLNKDMSDAKTVTGIESTNKTLDGLSEGTTYYWKVRSFNSEGKASAFSNVESFVAASVTGVETGSNSVIPEKFEVSKNYPNPFNPSTAIRLSLPAASFVTVKIYNMLGQEVKTLLHGQTASGLHTLLWHGEDNAGSILPSGSYIYRVTAGENVTTGKMMFLK
ncbi:MAG: T9SS type A sorting domain-containing protein [Ignavibacteria bacterium]|jgi:hypothetical protein|nr:T9SS type A sorting domain-containing protein [Ignavibacteria bacterium]MCU7500255.1 T9SS type A sorting domain-containing protein [Ignavibacteria bacterium]MCU7513664.1 T9SS type A sorting domain-containing protein [Ignavibacteria bacterium]MCU7520639.1 T9SS type A sorting domain-containing protein [Ignavibacteria bacterium]MCU7523537.1 T9SS type A sorting domain-containing protein [Ignavibacteria bacterium]